MDPPRPEAREAFRQSLHRAIANATPHAVDQLVREDAPKHDERDLLAKDRALLESVIAADEGEEREVGDPPIEGFGERNLYSNERDAFPDMLERVKGGRLLTQKQRGWVYSAAERLGVETKPVRAEDVPRGREVELAPVLSQKPLAPPGRKPPPEPLLGRTPLPEPTLADLFGGRPSSIEEQVAFGFGPRRGYGLATAKVEPLSVPDAEEDEKPCTCGGKGLGANGFHYPGAPGCLLVAPSASSTSEPPVFVVLMARVLGLPETTVVDAYRKALWMWEHSVEVTLPGGEKRTLYRTPEGTIDNCALAAGEDANGCQVCGGACPDRARFTRPRLPEILQEMRTGRLLTPEPRETYDDLPDFDARGSTEDDVPF